jgi:hypothetical protein
MQDCGHADVGSEIFGIYAKVFQRAGSARKKKVVDEGLVIPCQESELIGKRKGCQEIIDRQKLFLLAFQPERRVMILALRTAAMPAGTGPPFGVTAATALNKQLSGFRCPASLNRINGAQMAG